MLHLPEGEQTRSKSLSRRGYVRERKRPQVLWMLGLLHALGRQILERAAPAELPLTIVDVGGGRGDLALAIAACLGERLGVGREGVQVLVTIAIKV